MDPLQVPPVVPQVHMLPVQAFASLLQSKAETQATQVLAVAPVPPALQIGSPATLAQLALPMHSTHAPAPSQTPVLQAMPAALSVLTQVGPAAQAEVSHSPGVKLQTVQMLSQQRWPVGQAAPAPHRQAVPLQAPVAPQPGFAPHRQTPLLQVSLAPQALPQAPQLVALVDRVVQAPLQLAWPPVQTQVVPEQEPPVGQTTQTPPQQVRPDGQTVPHLPQLLSSVRRSVQVLLQAVCPAGQTQLVPEQEPPLGH